jgi:SAM-dependent methyltransferase
MLLFRATCDARPGSADNNQKDGIVKQAVERVNAGQAVYTPLTLKVYDHLVLGFSNRFLWRCPTSTLVDLYDRNASEVHLDVGVGTGYFLDKTAWPVENPDITLLDLNSNSLEAAATRIARYQRTTLKADISEPIPLERKYRSVGLCYLLHCLPGPISEKRPRRIRQRLRRGNTAWQNIRRNDRSGRHPKISFRTSTHEFLQSEGHIFKRGRHGPRTPEGSEPTVRKVFHTATWHRRHFRSREPMRSSVAKTDDWSLPRPVFPGRSPGRPRAVRRRAGKASPRLACRKDTILGHSPECLYPPFRLEGDCRCSFVI